MWNESRDLPEQYREMRKTGTENGSDLEIASCLEELGRPDEAAAKFREILRRFKSNKTLALTPNRAFAKSLDDYYVNVYINKKLGDCLRDKTFYQAALTKYPRLPQVDLRAIRSTDLVTTAQLEAILKPQRQH